MQAAFHEKALIVGHFDGELSWMTRDDFADLCVEEAELKEGDSFEARIETSEITGDCALVKVVNQVLGVWFTDYLSLLNIDGKWQIVNKTYYAHPDA